MKLLDARFALTFDDLMLVPQHSKVKSRKDPDVSTNLTKLLQLKIPIISAPMNTITESNMMVGMELLGGSSVLHRYMTHEEQFQHCQKAIQNGAKNFFVAIGASGDFLDRAYRLWDTLGIMNFCVDVANGHSEICLNAVQSLRKKIPTARIMAGNVCSRDGAIRLADVGTDIVRVGVGPGSMCKTRIVTGHGVPQLSAIEECAEVTRYHNLSVVADGGIRNSGDIVKALAAGADAVMLGGLLAGTDETPGDIVDYDTALPGAYNLSKMTILPELSENWYKKTGRYKTYAGMASEEGRKFNGWFTEENASFIPEGESTEVPCKGPVKNIVDNLVGGLKVGMSYAGSHSIKDLQENAEWVRVTPNGFKEGTPHGKQQG